MGLIDSLFSVNIQRLFMGGRADKAYERMYNVAERLAIHEMQQRTGKLLSLGKKRFDIQKNPWAYQEEIARYKEKRIEHHISEMKGLLKLRQEILEKSKK